MTRLYLGYHRAVVWQGVSIYSLLNQGKAWTDVHSADLTHPSNVCARYFPSPMLMLHTLVRDLKRSLTHMIQAIGTRSHLLLWLLSVGGVTAHAMAERAWFVGHLVVVIADLEIQSWSYMRQNLVQLALHDNFCDVSFHALYDEVKAKQKLLSIQPVVD